MAAKGGFRPGAGRKSNAAKRLEQESWSKILPAKTEESTWKRLLESKDERILLDSMKYLSDRIYGKAVERKEVSGPDGAAIPVSLEIDL